MDTKEKVIMKEGTIWVTKQYVKSGVVQKEESEEKRLLVHKFQTEPAYVGCKLGMTINIGNYESIRVDCSVNLPTYKEELTDAQQKAFEIASAELFKRVQEVKINL